MEQPHRLKVEVPPDHVVESAETTNPARVRLVRKASLLRGVQERLSYSALGHQELEQVLRSDLHAGLSSVEAKRRLKEHGPNLVQKVVPRTFFSILLDQVNTLNVLVMCSAAICFLRGTTIYGFMLGKEPDYFNGALLMGIVLTCMFIGAYMEWSCSRIMADVSSLTTPACHLVRDGEVTEVDVADVVPGDIAVLSVGDIIPADCIVIEATELQTCEVTLTGEPDEINKTLTCEDLCSPFPSNMLYASSSVVNGNGKGVVVRTGMETEIGKIAKQLDTGDVGVTQLQRTLNNLGSLVTVIVLALVICVFLVSFHMRVNDPADPCQASDSSCFLQKSLMRALFAACGAIPESLQPATMLLLVAGCYQMMSVKAAVRRLDAVDSLGACSFICSDKTGTLTEGKMTCMQLHLRLQDPPKEVVDHYVFYPTRGLDPRGGIFSAEALTDEAKACVDAMVDGDPGAQLPGTVEDLGDPGGSSPSARLVRTFMASAFLSSHATRLISSTDANGEEAFRVQGSTSEGALVAASGKARLDEVFLQSYDRIASLEVPFSSARKMMASIYKLQKPGCFEALQFDADAAAIAILKGAPDVLLPNFKLTVAAPRSSFDSGMYTLTGMFNDADSAWFTARNSSMASQGLRVLCVGLRVLRNSDLERLLALGSVSDRLQLLQEENLAVMGLVGLADPPRSTARNAVEKCHAAGIRVAMITGDQRATAEAIATDLGIVSPLNADKSVSECAVLAKTRSKDEIDELCHRINVWCRAQPTDKVTIVESLQRQGHIVAMTGDGVNDAAALKKANIGVAMGLSGTDVAKSAADVVLLDDRFRTIVDAVSEGRRIFNNVQRMSAYLLCGNIFPVVTVMGTMVLGWAVPLEDAQLFKANFVTHMFYPWCMIFERLPFYGMMQPPRDRSKPIVPALMARVLIPVLFIAYFTSMLTAQLAGALLYVGTVDRDEQTGTDLLSEFYDEDRNHVCLYANEVYGVPMTLEKRKQDATSGGIELVYKRDVAPLHCKIRRLTLTGWEYVEEWGHTRKEDSEKALQSQDFNWFTGSWGQKFSLKHSFLADSFVNGVKSFEDSNWRDPHGWLVKCNAVIAKKKSTSEAKAGDSDRLCWKPCGHQLCWEKDLSKQASNASSPESTEAREEEDEPVDKPVLYKKYHVAAWGCRRMRSVVLVSMIFMELAMLFSLSKHEYSFGLVFDNLCFPLAWIPMVAVTMFYIYTPVTFVDQLFAPLDGIGIGTALIIALAFYSTLEVAKVAHRHLFLLELAEKIAVGKLGAEGRVRAFCRRREAWQQYPERCPTSPPVSKTGPAQGYGSCNTSVPLTEELIGSMQVQHLERASAQAPEQESVSSPLSHVGDEEELGSLEEGSRSAVPAA